MKRLPIIAAAVVVLAIAGAVGLKVETDRITDSLPRSDRELHHVAMATLRKAPNQFHQKRVAVVSFWRYGFEEAYLYPSENEVGLSELSVGVDITPSMASDAGRLSGHYVSVTGRFISQSKSPRVVDPRIGRIENVEVLTLDSKPTDVALQTPNQSTEPTKVAVH